MNKPATLGKTGTDMTIPVEQPVDPLAEASPETALATRASENIGLTIAAGLALGLVAGALWPRRKSREIAKTSSTITDLLGEVRRLVAVQALDRAATVASDSRDKLDSVGKGVGKAINDGSARVKKRTQRLADEASDHLHDTGKAIARAAVKLVEKTRS